MRPLKETPTIPTDAWKGWSAEAIAEGVQDDKHDHAYVIKRYERPSE